MTRGRNKNKKGTWQHRCGRSKGRQQGTIRLGGKVGKGKAQGNQLKGREREAAERRKDEDTER